MKRVPVMVPEGKGVGGGDGLRRRGEGDDEGGGEDAGGGGAVGAGEIDELAAGGEGAGGGGAADEGREQGGGDSDRAVTLLGVAFEFGGRERAGEGGGVGEFFDADAAVAGGELETEGGGAAFDGAGGAEEVI